MENLRTRTWLTVIAIAAAALFVVPNFVDTTAIKWLPSTKLNYGLDIQGGLHLVMGVDVEGVISTSVTRQTQVLVSEFAKDGFAVKSFDTARAKEGKFSIVAATADDAKKVEAHIQKTYPASLQVVSASGETVEVKYLDAYLLEQKQNVIRQAIETIRNRIDEFGVAEPSITQQGSDRILIQLPGMADAEKAKQLINTTAKLDFMMVSYDKSPEEIRAMITEAEKAGGYSITTMKYSEYIAKLNADLAGKLPPKTIIYFQKLDSA
ncbi:MAG: protein translocase subunit SecD, partial [Bdellovibrionaceae bacterium]|nr:protein translocase subunit SecD [Pseudobdellovibrionaceae bacterium]